MTGEPLAPAKKKKQVCDVCGAPISPEPENKSTRQKRKSKFMTCAERPSRPRQRTITHAKKEKASLRRVRSAHLARAREPKHTPKKKKQVCDVCGAAISPAPENQNTRQKEKASFWRVRSGHLACTRELKHTSKRKSKFMTCAERPSRPRQRTKVHVKKKKRVYDVCGAPISPAPENQNTRQKEKASL